MKQENEFKQRVSPCQDLCTDLGSASHCSKSSSTYAPPVLKRKARTSEPCPEFLAEQELANRI
eukprot:1638866-Rhodomonas_salina.2